MANDIFVVALLMMMVCHLSLSQDSTPFIVNLDAHCMRCLCYAATKCDLTTGCDKGYCGPFKISKLYWKDAGEVTLADDDKERAGAYEDCAISYQCAQKMVANYIVKYGRDCNEDGVTNCEDYSMINFNGGFQCRPALNRTDAGSAWLQRYRTCNPEFPTDIPEYI